MSETKIVDRCPSCGHETLFVGTGGYLTCSWLKCPEPGVGRAIESLRQLIGVAHDRWHAEHGPRGVCYPSVQTCEDALCAALRRTRA